MPIQIDVANGRATSVARDLMKICPDPSLWVDASPQAVQSPDGGTTIVALGSGSVGFRNRPNGNDPSVVVGTQLIAALTDPITTKTVVIRGLGSDDTAFDHDAIRNSAGKTSPVIIRGDRSFVFIDYDVDGCNRGPGFKSGYTAIGQNKQSIDMPPDVVLFHELVHAFRGLNGIASADAGTEELETAKQENLYRAQRMLPLRSTETLMDIELFHAGQPSCNTAIPAATTTTTKAGSYCGFVVAMATATAVGSHTAPNLQPLREFRNDYVLNTRSGQEFYAVFDKYYYQYGARIAEAMRNEPAMGAAFRIGFVEPIVQYLSLFLEFPQGDLASVPEPWRSYLHQVESAFSYWAGQLPLPASYRDQPAATAARELAILLRYCVRDSEAIGAYLTSLEKAGELPLAAGNFQERAEAIGVLSMFGHGEAIIARVVGPEPAPSPLRTTRTLSAYGPNERPPNPDPEELAYTVSIRNTTDLTDSPITFAEVVVTLQRIGMTGVEFRFEDNVAPGKGVAFALCPCKELASYAWGVRYQVSDNGELVDQWDGWGTVDANGDYHPALILPHDQDDTETMLFGAPVPCADSFTVGA